MSGFDNGTLWGGVFFQAKQFGSILRGFGPPVPEAGVAGDLYIDVQSWQLFCKRAFNETDPWGHYLWYVPTAYQANLKWFSASPPSNTVGRTGDYCLAWAGFNNYGMQPSIYGPKTASGWPENGEGTDTQYDPAFAGFVLPVGLSDEGTPIAFSSSTQLIVAGLADEYILAIPVTTIGGTAVGETGLQGTPANVMIVPNPLYAAEDGHNI
jgi:hypothetical protein